MAKPKYDFKDATILTKVEELARDGAYDKQIAEYFGYNETYFCELKAKITELSEALKKGRAPLDFNVENSLFKKCIGYKQRVQKPFKLKDKYYDEEGRLCEKERVEVVEVEETVFPEVLAQIFWLKNRKPKVWNKSVNDEEEDKQSEGSIPISKWIENNTITPKEKE